MSLIGENRILTPMETLPGEKILWEGPAASKASVFGIINYVVLGGLFLSIISTFYILFQIEYMRKMERKTPSPKVSSSMNREQRQKIFREHDEKMAALREDALKKAAFQGGTVFLCALLALGVIGFFSHKKNWYVITNERIVIQRGLFSSVLSVIDMDKIGAVSCSSTMSQRLLGLCSISLQGNFIPHLPSPGTTLVNTSTIANIEINSELISLLTNSWLPRDNRG